MEDGECENLIDLKLTSVAMALFQALHVEKQLLETLCKEDGSGFTRIEERSSCLNMGEEKP